MTTRMPLLTLLGFPRAAQTKGKRPGVLSVAVSLPRRCGRTYALRLPAIANKRARRPRFSSANETTPRRTFAGEALHEDSLIRTVTGVTAAAAGRNAAASATLSRPLVIRAICNSKYKRAQWVPSTEGWDACGGSRW